MKLRIHFQTIMVALLKFGNGWIIFIPHGMKNVITFSYNFIPQTMKNVITFSCRDYIEYLLVKWQLARIFDARQRARLLHVSNVLMKITNVSWGAKTSPGSSYNLLPHPVAVVKGTTRKRVTTAGRRLHSYQFISGWYQSWVFKPDGGNRGKYLAFQF